MRGAKENEMAGQNAEKKLTELVQEMVDRGARTAEDIHRAVGDLPVTVLERLGLDQTAEDVKRIQDTTIGGIYDLIRDVNHKVAKLADEILEQGKLDAGGPKETAE
jgi:polyhydroxyalkanoate synthesis regulator phasin